MARYRFKVAKAFSTDVGRGRVRIHVSRRGGANRFTVFKITKGSGRSILAAVLGHEEEQGVIQIDFDQRHALGVRPGESVELDLTELGMLGKLRWYLSAHDPAVHVPAWLAFWSVLLGLGGLILGIAAIISG